MSDQRVFGLIGFPLSHSFSVNYFAEKFRKENITDAVYKNFEIDSLEKLDLVLNDPGLRGLNVTIPYKEKIISYLDKISPEAEAIGAVNTIRIHIADGKRKLEGFNTDAFGFSMSLKPFLLNTHERALILGNGGAAKAVKHVLHNLGVNYLTITRNKGEGDLIYEELNEYILRSHLLIIQTTPVGMHPAEDECPHIPYEHLGPGHLLYDLIYNPEETLFLKKGKQKGAVILNGLSMLRLQAEKSWQIWNDEE
jgi:shikimate dehydrogenase